MLTPMDIHNHQFKKSMVRGYNENEVDDFLDRIVVDFERLLRENERLKNDLTLTETEIDKYRKLEKTMNDTLLMAQRTADDVISAARKNADEMKENTARECQNIREQARLEAQKKIEDANIKRAAIFEECRKVISEKNAFLLKFRTALESELAIVNQNISEVTQVEMSAEKIAQEKVAPKKVAPVEKKSPPVEKPKPIEKPAKPEKAPVSTDSGELNLVDVSTKPVAEKKTVVSEETKIYTFNKKSPAPDEEAAM